MTLLCQILTVIISERCIIYLSDLTDLRFVFFDVYFYHPDILQMEIHSQRTHLTVTFLFARLSERLFIAEQKKIPNLIEKVNLPSHELIT